MFVFCVIFHWLVADLKTVNNKLIDHHVTSYMISINIFLEFF